MFGASTVEDPNVFVRLTVSAPLRTSAQPGSPVLAPVVRAQSMMSLASVNP